MNLFQDISTLDYPFLIVTTSQWIHIESSLHDTLEVENGNMNLVLIIGRRNGENFEKNIIFPRIFL